MVDINSDCDSALNIDNGIEINLWLGGKLSIYPDMICEHTKSKLVEAAEKFPIYRQYKIQGGLEPRSHALLTMKEGRGYKYHGVKMMGYPLSDYPIIQETVEMVEKALNVPEFGIGIDVIKMRDWTQYIGFHADNSQGESDIVTLIASTPRRTIEIRSYQQCEKGKGRC